MSSQLFSRNYDPSFTPLFRLLSDFDNYARESQAVEDSPAAPKQRTTRLVSPKFDLHETKETYELHGELPGFGRENVHIEFIDNQTISISGQVERSYSSGTPPHGMIEGGKVEKGKIEAGEEHNNHKASVEDEESAAAKEKGPENNSHVVKHKGQKQKTPEHTDKFWVSERSFGKFQRQFSFPTPVNQDDVKASLKDGILNVSIPKAKPKESRRIAIN